MRGLVPTCRGSAPEEGKGQTEAFCGGNDSPRAPSFLSSGFACRQSQGYGELMAAQKDSQKDFACRCPGRTESHVPSSCGAWLFVWMAESSGGRGRRRKAFSERKSGACIRFRGAESLRRVFFFARV